jgi:hypothetical protein
MYLCSHKFICDNSQYLEIIFQEISQMDGVNVMPRMPIFYHLTRRIAPQLFPLKNTRNYHIWKDMVYAP